MGDDNLISPSDEIFSKAGFTESQSKTLDFMFGRVAEVMQTFSEHLNEHCNETKIHARNFEEIARSFNRVHEDIQKCFRIVGEAE